MIKEIRNVVITFLLIAVMLVSGTFFYSKKVLADEESAKATAEQKQKELAAQALLEAQLHARAVAQEKLLAEQQATPMKTIPVPTATVVGPVAPQKSSTNFADAIAKQQAAYAAQEKAKADALAQQQAADVLAQQQADLAAQQQAQADAYALQMARQNARRSRVSSAS